MYKFILSFLLVISCNVALSQLNFSWEQKANMPKKISNNAVTSATIAGNLYTYSFGGIDSTKLYSGITRKSYRYNVSSDIWDTIPQLPDTMGKIASSAVTVKNKIYILGGYYVLANSTEISSNQVHIYDPATNAYLPNGMTIPTPIDDQVMCVWRDSLIFVITGWVNNTNTDKVQIYNTALNTWTLGTSVPNTNNYKAFGASGTIIGDTIYYCGGASTATNFPAVSVFRKGVINPANPALITWTYTTTPSAKVYRSGSSSFNNVPLWLGGSLTTYNYNGIAYNGTGGVVAQDQVIYLNRATNLLMVQNGQIPSVMDLRGVAKISANEYIISGGMGLGQQVSKNTYKITVTDVTSINESEKQDEVVLFPNPCSYVFNLKNLQVGTSISIYNAFGDVVYEEVVKKTVLEINMNQLSDGIYFCKITKNEKSILKKVLVQR